MSLNCNELIYDGLLERWLDGGLDRELADKISAHVDSCPACMDELSALKEEEKHFKEALQLTDDESQLVQPKVLELKSPTRKARIQWLWKHPGWISVAASIFIVIIIFSHNQWPGNKIPVISLDSAVARPGETVMVALRTKNLVGRSGLKARVTFDPALVEVTAAEGSMGLSRVVGNEIIIAALSLDGWQAEDGVAFRLPVTVRQDAHSNTTITLALILEELADSGQDTLEAQSVSGNISII